MAVPHIESEAIAAATPWPDLIEALRQAFASRHKAPDRHIHEIAVPGEPEATALLMPAWIEGDVYGVKLANIFPGNGARGEPSISSLYAVFSARTGRLLATLDGGALTVRRTAAASALASTYLSRPESRTLLIVGAGRMAPMLAAAHKAARPISRTLIWARDPGKAEAIASELAIEAASALEPAVREADIVSTATLAHEPLVMGTWLKPGMHLDLVGAYSPSRREVDSDAVERSTVFIDTLGGSMAEAGDLIQAAAEGRFSWDAVAADLAALATGRHRGRRDSGEITLFKSVGAAIEDLAAARLVLKAEGLLS